MIDLAAFNNLQLVGGFSIADIRVTGVPLVDALGREAAAQTRIIGVEFRLLIRSELSDEELSVTLYHEILEAAAVGSLNPPESVASFTEADFEQTARRMHDLFGKHRPKT
jgi:hypothetical protein